VSGICWHWQAPASKLIHGTDHGIAVLNISVVIQYHVMRVEPLMVFEPAHLVGRPIMTVDSMGHAENFLVA
jgi:hypothetical protein